MNKAAYKLKGLPPIYCINLDGEPHRWEAAESMFKEWEVENYTRVSAYDGREDDLSDILKGKYPNNMTSSEVGCTTSHLKALKMFLETDAPCALMMEDDCDLSTITYWPFTWKDFYAKVPYDYDVVQLAVINPAEIHMQFHKRFVNDFSTACYMITRRHAQKLLDFHVRGNKYKLDNGVKPRPVADDLIYNSGNTYSIPLLLYKTDLGSSIHPEHVDAYHIGNYKAQSNYWITNGAQMSIQDQMNYDPYLGRITENSAAVAAAKEAENPSS